MAGIKPPIRVIGLPVDGTPVDKRYQSMIAESDLLVGGNRHLERFPDLEGEKIPIRKETEEVLNAIATARGAGKNVTVLATGDPLWHGIGSTLVRRFGPKAVEIHPAVSSPQVALARLKLPMDDAIVLSRHRRTNTPLDLIRYFSTCVILTSGPEGPTHVIHDLTHSVPGATDWFGAVCQCLGSPKETIDTGTLATLAVKTYLTPNLLVVRNPTPQSLVPTTADFGRPDDAFSHKGGLITHPEVRAVALSKLSLEGAKTLWDVGAGSGAVGIEAALLNPGMAVHAIEKDLTRAKQIATNCDRFRVSTLIIHAGDIAEQFPTLPIPDRIFIGGGGRDLADLLPSIFEKLLPGGLLVATTVTLESLEMFSQFMRSQPLKAEVIQLQTTRLTPFSSYHKMVPDNPVTLFRFIKNKRS